MREVKITNIHHGKGAKGKNIYAKLVDAKTNELLISATIDYILIALKLDNNRYLVV